MWRALIVNAFVICLWAGAATAQDKGGVGTLVVTGAGQTSAVPNEAKVTLGVAHEARLAKQAMDRVNADVSTLFERLAELGVQPRDVQTTQLRLDPMWRDRNRSTPPEPPQIIGFVARNELTIRLRDMDRLGEVLQVLVDNGANQLSGVSFSVREPEPLLDTARSLAVRDAQRRAETLALAAGVTLGRVLEISEADGGGPTPVFARAEAMPVAGGELTFEARVRIVYAIRN